MYFVEWAASIGADGVKENPFPPIMMKVARRLQNPIVTFSGGDYGLYGIHVHSGPATTYLVFAREAGDLCAVI